MNVSNDEKIIEGIEVLSEAKYPLTEEERLLAAEIVKIAADGITNKTLLKSAMSTISDEKVLGYLESLMK